MRNACKPGRVWNYGVMELLPTLFRQTAQENFLPFLPLKALSLMIIIFIPLKAYSQSFGPSPPFQASSFPFKPSNHSLPKAKSST